MSAPHRWMLFVDGENLAIRAQNVATAHKLSLAHQATYHVQDVAFWSRMDARILALPSQSDWRVGGYNGIVLERVAERAFYYTSMVGGYDKVEVVRGELHRRGWTARVFKRKKDEHRKQVDIHLTTKMLEHAFRDNYDLAVLVSGDRDFLPAVEAVQRAGKRVVLARLPQDQAGVADELQLACDYVENLWRLLDVFAHCSLRHRSEVLKLTQCPKCKHGFACNQEGL